MTTASGDAIPEAHSARARRVSVVLVVAAVYLAFDPWGWDSFRPFRWLLVSAVAAVAIASVLHGTLVTDRRPTLAFAALVSWVTVSAVFAADPLHAWIGTPDRHMGLLTWVLFGGLFVVGQSLVAERDVQVLLRTVIVTGGLAGLYATIELVGWSPVDVSFADSRVGGPWGQPAYLAAGALLALPLAVDHAVRERSPTWKAVAAGSALFCTIAVGASQTRGAWIGLAVGLITAAVLYRDQFRRLGKNLLPLGALVVVVALLVGLLTPLGSRAISTFDLTEGTARGRVDEWRVGTSALVDRPIFGAGPEGYRVVFPESVTDTYEQRYTRQTTPDRAHNGLLDVGLASGLPGMLLYVLVLGLVLSRAIRRREADPPWLAGVAVALVAYVVQQQFLFPMAEVDPVFWVLAGVVVMHSSVQAQWQVVNVSRIAAAPVVGLAAVLAVVGVIDVAADHRTAAAVEASQAGDSATARQNIDSAISLRPDSIRYRFVAARLAQASPAADRLDHALLRLNQGLDLSAEDPALLTERAAVLVDLGLQNGGNDLAVARAEIERLVAIDPNNAGHRLKLGILLGSAGDVRAEAQLLEAARLAPQNVVPELNLAVLYLEENDSASARAAIGRAQQIDADDPRVQALFDQVSGQQ